MDSSQQQQQQYPNLNPHNSTNGSATSAQNSMANSKVRLLSLRSRKPRIRGKREPESWKEHANT